MRIGIDMDGVLTELERFHIDYGSKYCFENDIEFNVDLSKYDMAGAFSITKEQSNDFWRKYLELYAKETKAKEFAKEIIDKLKEDKNEIYIITSRWLTDREDDIGNNMRNTTKNWLYKNQINYDKLIFTKKKKSEHCIENKIDLMIEDDSKNINEISKTIPVICFDASYNKECQGKNIIRCYSWYDIYSKIVKMEGHNGK